MEHLDSRTSNSHHGSTAKHEQQSRKAAACLVCRRSKIRCERGPDRASDRCQRCTQLGAQCIRPAFHVGRRKGVKNKRTGLEKALYQIEEAVRRSGSSRGDAAKAVSNIKALLGPGAEDALKKDASPDHPRQGVDAGGMPDASSDDSSGSDQEDDHRTQSTVVAQGRVPEESLAIDDAENPLQLLARASDLHVSPASGAGQPASPDSIIRRTPHPHDSESSLLEAENFFRFGQFNLDAGPELDPIELGLVTDEEADSLFSFFHQKLAHTRWGLDPVLYTSAFTRSRSAFLFTSILAASALFMPSASALSRRLSNHCRTLASRIIANRFRSVEIVLAFMVNVPWMFPGKHSADDETCWYVSMATTMAIDLSLHKIIVAPESSRDGMVGTIPRADCIDPKLALSLDGFGEVDPVSDVGRRLLRRRERCWIALFVLERGMCLARGRVYTVPVTPILRLCDQWHMSSIADTMDGHLASMAVLRRDLDDLFATIRSVCDGSQTILTNGSVTAQSIQTIVENFFEKWQARWGMSIGTGPQHQLPPYVQILVTHTRLSIYGSVINHPTAPTEVRHFFHNAGLSSALNVMRAAVRGESQLMSMPNNTAIMISFAACFALRLCGQISGNSSLAPSIRKLIEETAGVLERIGSVTPHRNGMSTLYGKYLRCIVRKAASTTTARPEASVQQQFTPLRRTSQAGFAATEPMISGPGVGYMVAPAYAEQVQFSTMSDDQIAEALNRAGNEFDPDLNMFSWDDAAALDWLNWSNLPEFGT
ncbi:hypothetical protein GQ53DRAFT_667295 [Thozetella sp. PMI_491]|nr:hypothetical protein GQ53DRAFT_667295 [Thozetella sp. PMI_491]